MHDWDIMVIRTGSEAVLKLKGKKAKHTQENLANSSLERE